jgi:hypothetical protein
MTVLVTKLREGAKRKMSKKYEIRNERDQEEKRKHKERQKRDKQGKTFVHN